MSPVQDSGKFNFNSDLELLDQFFFPDPAGPSGFPTAGPTALDGGARLAVGDSVMYHDPTGNLPRLDRARQKCGA